MKRLDYQKSRITYNQVAAVASIAVLRGVRDLYTYIIPESLADIVGPGTPVTVPFGSSSAPGIVIDIDSDNPPLLKLKEIISIDTKRPTVRTDQLALVKWFIAHYLCSPFSAIQTVIGRHKILDTEATLSTDITESNLELSTEQRSAVTEILSAHEISEILIHGVTGSGKTEIYLEVARQFQKQGQSTIVLVPEIALTPQVSRIFQARLGNEVAILHSGLTPKQKTTTWNKIYSGKTRIVIGPRSAIFAPLLNIGAIIVDECHDGSYKQEQAPRYDTLQVARIRAKIANATLVLGSATPTLEQIRSVEIGQSRLIRLPNRIMNRPMATYHVSDIRDRDQFPDDSLIGRPLLDALKIASAKKEKAIILVNRRGYAPTVICQRCRNTVTCPECDLGYTYHSDRILRCHRCFTQTPLKSQCPSCKHGTVTISGTAIQKVELELRKLLPDSEILRLDKDTGTHPKRISEIMDSFRESGDILIGTQMIAKGHDIAQVTVVGIVGIDAALGIPDFRAGERAFQLITQVAGRAGRGEISGDVYIQTGKPNHYAISAAVNHDIDRFYSTEMKFRQHLNYPPYSELVNIIISGINPESVGKTAILVRTHLVDTLDPQIATIMPAQAAAVTMIRGHTRWHILIKVIPNHGHLIRAALKSLPATSRSIRVIVDFDPQSIL